MIGTPVATPDPFPALTIVRDQRPTYDAEPVVGGRLRIVRPTTDPTDFSPVAFRPDFQVSVSYLDPLLRADELTMEPRPWLAQRWRWSDDDRVITYSLRSDVRWHDGAPLTAADVQFSLLVHRDDPASGVRNFFALMEEVEVVDDRTLRVTLSERDGGWLFNASTQFVFQRAQYIDHWTSRPRGERTLSGFDWRDSLPVGTGPWQIEDWDEGGVGFVRHDGYWADPPFFERMSLRWENSAADRLASWRQGEADLLWPVRAAEAARVGDRPGRLYAADAASVMFAAFNFENPVRAVADLFDDVHVRRALSLAIDRRRYAEEVFAGFTRYQRAGTIAQPWANDPSVTNPARDVDAARALLTEAGWVERDGDATLENEGGQPFVLTAILSKDARPELLRVMQRVRFDLAEIGVVLRVEPLAEDRFRERWRERHDFDLIAYAYDLYPGFTDFDLYGSGWDIRVNPRGWNPGGYGNREVDAAVREAMRATDVDAQRAALRRLQRAADEDLFALWLGFPQDLILVAADVLGFQPNKRWQTWDTRTLWRENE